MNNLDAALMGAYVADAAALGVHWLYDADRLADVAKTNPAFLDPDPAYFGGYKGVFVHSGKKAGDLSHYGAHMRVAVQSLIATSGRFDPIDFQDRFAATFGSGGSWVGYIDKATRGTLANIAADRRDPSGTDDDQVPAIAKLPPLMGMAGVTLAEAAFAVATTNANEMAARWSRPAALVLQAIYHGVSISDALSTAIAASDVDIARALTAALETSEDNSSAFAGEVGRACPLPQSLPVMFHIAARATSYQDAIERNILAGGDNCGRAPVLGAIFGAFYGVGGGAGVPLAWLGKLNDAEALSAEVAALAQIQA